MVTDAGVDTWSICWYLGPDSAAERAAKALMSVPAPRGRLLPESVAGHRVGLFGSERMLYAEGHPAEGRLAKPVDLPPSFEQVVSGLQDRGILPPSKSLLHLVGPAGLRPGTGGRGLAVSVVLTPPSI